MPDRLDEHENHIQHERNHADKHQLRRRQYRPGNSAGEIGQDHGQTLTARTAWPASRLRLQLEILFVMAHAAASRQIPTIPLHTIMIAANTVSRGSAGFLGAARTITETISATSITVTAIARTSVPKGSPTRCATTSAW